jgi:DNA-binding response OmpR family regulator
MAQILLIDDDDQFRDMLRITLQRMGHDVVEAADGRIALRLGAQQNFDVAMVDMIMPDKEGMETITEMRKSKPDMRIIAMSGGGRMNSRDILLLAAGIGANKTLAKPFSNEELADALRAVNVQ